MENKKTRFLNIGLILVSLFCIAIFVVQAVGMNLMGENAIRQLGIFYMSGISEQVSAHFETMIELRLSQVESLVSSVPPGRFTGETSMQINLTYNARSAGFEYLAYYTEDGAFHMIYGSQMRADDPEIFHQSVQGGKYNVCAGKDKAGTQIVLMGVPANYPMDDGNTSIALVAGLPADYLSAALNTNISSDIIEYTIIRDDGSYVLHNSSAIEESNYFERIENIYEVCGGKEPAEYARELHDALDNDKDYTSEVLISGKHWNIYCTSLPNSEWHLILKISHNELDETVNVLQKKWSCISIGGCTLIICVLLLVFAGYYRLTKKQMRALEEAWEAAENAKLLAERSNRVKNEFLSNMSHDIRTPMNGIMGMTSIAINNLDNPSRVRSCLKRIHVSSRHLMGLINDMLDMSKIESGKLTLNMEPLFIPEIMQNTITVIQPLLQEKKQHFKVYVHDVFHENVCSDRVRLTQILLNILGNAVKFTHEGGIIEAELHEEPSSKGDGYILSHLHIRDNGIGMSKEFQDKIFDAFAREDNARVDKAAGAGMGMTITKNIVDAMGGTITVESEQGKGTHFHVAIDMEKIVYQEKELRLPKRNVLLIDGDEASCALTVSALESIGLRTESAVGIRKALRMLEARRGKEKYYHMVLLDWGMWKQEELEAARELFSRFGSELPIILLIDGEWDEREERAQRAGASGLISKPLFRSSLYYGLRRFAEEEAVQQAQDCEPDISLAGKRILIAEDNELNWEIAHEILSEFELETEWAEDGKICVEKFEQSPPGWYDAILMDLRMPVMTGYEASEAIRRLKREDARTVPIIAVSANAFEEDIWKCFESGMNDHTAKPFDTEKILALLKGYLL